MKAGKPHRKATSTSVRGTPGELGVDEWFELNSRDDGSRYELIDGNLIVSPAPSFGHRRLGDRLRAYLESVCPREMVAVTATGLLLDRKPGVIPDLMVVDRAPFEEDAEVARAEWVRLVVEIVSRSATATDRRIKHTKYAEAGIPHFWRIEMRPFRGQGNEKLSVIFAYALEANNEYRLTHRIGAGSTLELTEPFPLTLVPAVLTEI
ncbi:Uma2 family endonuclease [Streptosporangium sp. NPDC051022]|uniref:Uma2 family endonuclease n=1 Tax=Streptosporangium sp. NPDC051022 TaxID=3155752 RepID=UPI0034131D74